MVTLLLYLNAEALLTFLEFVQICTVSFQMVIFNTSQKHELQYLNLKFRLLKGVLFLKRS